MALLRPKRSSFRVLPGVSPRRARTAPPNQNFLFGNGMECPFYTRNEIYLKEGGPFLVVHDVLP